MLFRALIWRPLRRDWGRTLVSVLAIALGVAVVIAVRIANRSAIASFESTNRFLADDASLLATGPQPLPMALLARLFPLNAQAEFTPYLDRQAYDPNGRDTLEIFATDLVAAARGMRALPGTHEPTEPSIILASEYANAHHLRVGDVLTLEAGSERSEVRIAGLIPGGTLAPTNAAVLDLADGLRLFEPGLRPEVDGLQIALAPQAKASEVAAAVRTLLPAVDAVGPPRARVQQDAKMLAAFRANLEALAYASLLVGIFLIYNTVSISVVRRRTAIAALRALGARRRRIQWVFLGESAALAVPGGALGLGLGWLLAHSAVSLTARTISNLYVAGATERMTPAAADAVWAFVLALGAGLMAGWLPARTASRLQPAVTLRAGTAEARVRSQSAKAWWVGGGLGAAAYALAKTPGHGTPWVGIASALAAVLALAALTPALLAVSLPRIRARMLRQGMAGAGMAASSLAGALRRSAVLVAALAMAIGVMLGVATMVGSFRQTVQVWIGQQLQDDVFIRTAEWDRNRPAPLAPQIVARILATPDVARARASRTQPWSFRGEPIIINTRWALTRKTPAARYELLAGHPGAVMVSEPFARHFHVWTGDRIPFNAPNGRMTLTVAGVFYDYSSDRGLVVLDPHTYEQGFGPPAITEMGIDACAHVSASELRRRIEISLRNQSGLAINDNATLRSEALQVFDQTFRITYALEAIALLVAILGVGNTLLAVVLERGHELATLRFLGATRRQIRNLLLIESGLVGSFALAIGWGMGAVLAVILVKVVNVESFGWTIQFHAPYGVLFAASASVWLATLCAGWLPARFAQRQAEPSALGAE